MSGFVVFAGLALVALQTGPAKSWLAAFLSERASTATGFEVRIGAIDGTVPNDITLAGVEVADADGVWLRASGVALDWHPTALLAGRLQVARAGVATLDIARAPVTPPSADAAASPSPPPSPPWAIELPALPVAVAVANLELPEIHLGMDLLGEEMTLAAFGSARLGDKPQTAEAALTVLRLDGVPARLDLTFAQAQPDGALTLDAALEEPAGGLIARLLDLPDLPAVRLRLAGSGPVDGWSGRLDAAAGEASAHFDLTLAIDDRVDLTLAGDLNPGGVAGPELGELLRQPATVAAALAWTPGGALDIAHAELTAPGLAASLTGKLDLEAGDVDARAILAVEDEATIARLAAPATAAALRVELRLGGDLAAPRLAVDATIDRPRAPGVGADSIRVVANAASAEDSTRLTIEGRVTPEGLAIADAAGLDTLIGSAPVLSFAGVLDSAEGGLDIARLDIAGDSLRVTGGGRIAAAGRDLDLALRCASTTWRHWAALPACRCGAGRTPIFIFPATRPCRPLQSNSICAATAWRSRTASSARWSGPRPMSSPPPTSKARRCSWSAWSRKLPQPGSRRRGA
ncbi:MAG: hypothetical protein AB7O45_14110 [Alphaproteobacteria bacterium]